MRSDEDGGQAFPDENNYGLSFMDYMAGQALVAFGVEYVRNQALESLTARAAMPSDAVLARYCYRIARAMNEERERRRPVPREAFETLLTAAGETVEKLGERFSVDDQEGMVIQRLRGAVALSEAADRG